LLGLSVGRDGLYDWESVSESIDCLLDCMCDDDDGDIEAVTYRSRYKTGQAQSAESKQAVGQVADASDHATAKQGP
jgi:hypothetical protein